MSSPTLLRMLGNVALETLLGVIPVVGDLFDVGWKANVRNVKLIDDHLKDPELQHRASTLAVATTMLGLAGAAAIAVWSTIWALGLVVRLAVAAGWPVP